MAAQHAPPASVIDAARRSKISAPPDKLDRLREAAARARDLLREIADLEARAEEKRRELSQLMTKDLVDVMDEAHSSRFDLVASGNEPAYELKLVPHYSASIPASWSAEKQQAALDWLQANGHGGLIKTILNVPFPRDKRTLALKEVERLRKKGLAFTLKESVHQATLTAWLRETVESGTMPPLETIGGYVGRVVQIKPKKGD